MLFRISFENFLVHCIDHFTLDEITTMYYVVVSAGIKVMGRMSPSIIVKANDLYPDFDSITDWMKYKNNEALRKEYIDHLKKSDASIYHRIISHVIDHRNVCLMCMDNENVYLDILAEYLKDKFSVECIDLNELFTKGRIGKIYIDRDEIHNRSVGIRRSAVKEYIASRELSPEGRLELMTKMTKKDKIRKLQQIGFSVRKNDHENLNKLLLQEWVEE